MMLVFVAGTSCNSPKAGSLNTIVELYGGKFSLENGVRASTSEGKVNYVKVVCEENKLIGNGWLSPEATAYNCAFLLTKANPDILDKNDLLEMEFSNINKPPFSFKKKDLEKLEREYNSSEKAVKAFVDAVNTNNLKKAIDLMESSPNLSESDLTTFLTTFKNVNLTNYRETRLIGFIPNSEGGGSYLADFFIISQDDVQKMAKAVLIPTENGLKFREVTY